MGMTNGDWAYEQYALEQELLELQEGWIAEFRKERLRSYYLEQPLLAQPAFNALNEARSLADERPSAALIFAATAIEVGYRETLLKPIIYGLVHSQVSAKLIADSVTAQSSMDKLKDILFHVLYEHTGTDLASFIRSGTTKTLWQEMKQVQELRNRILHRADTVSNAEANHAIEVASTILEVLFPVVVTGLDLQVSNIEGVWSVSGAD